MFCRVKIHYVFNCKRMNKTLHVRSKIIPENMKSNKIYVLSITKGK